MVSYKEAFNVEKLNNTNYQIWKFKIQMYLIKEELFTVITKQVPNPLTAEWTKKDAKASAIINLSLEDNQFVDIRNIESATDT